MYSGVIDHRLDFKMGIKRYRISIFYNDIFSLSGKYSETHFIDLKLA